MSGAEFSGGFSSSFGTAGAVDSFIGLVYRHGKDITVTPEQGVAVRHGPYPVGPSLHPTSTWKNTESGSVTFVVISKDRHNSQKRVTNVPVGQRQLKESGKRQSQAEANAAAYYDKHEHDAKRWTSIPLKVSWDVMIVRWEYVDKVLDEKQGVLESSFARIARLQQTAKSFGAGTEGLAKIEVEIGRIRERMFAVREEMFGILAFRAMFEGIVLMFNCRVTELSEWGRWRLSSPQNCVVKMGFKIRTNEKNGHTGMSIVVRFEEKVASWTRLKLGKLEIHDGKFKSFTGEIGEDCANLKKISNPNKTWAESIPVPSTKGLEYIYKKSSSWAYLDQVRAGQDPDISAHADQHLRAATPAAGGPPARSRPVRSNSQANISGAPRQPVRRSRTESGDGGRRGRPQSGALDLSDVMEEIGASPKRQAAASKSSDRKTRRHSSKPAVRDASESGSAIETGPITSSTDPPNGSDSWARPGKQSRVRARRTQDEDARRPDRG